MSTTTTICTVTPRKRTSSFCIPRPAKAQRTNMGSSSLRRTESYITLADIRASSTTTKTPTQTLSPNPSNGQLTPLPYYRTMQYQKDQRDARRRAVQQMQTQTHPLPHTNHTLDPITIRICTDSHPIPIPIHVPQPTSHHHHHHPAPTLSSSSTTTTPRKTKLTIHALPQVYTPPRHTSPLAPTRAVLPGRPIFPRSKPEPDLYRKALRTCMKRQGAPEGQKVKGSLEWQELKGALEGQTSRMKPKVGVVSATTRDLERATQDLERIVRMQVDREREREAEMERKDVEMKDMEMKDVDMDMDMGDVQQQVVMSKSWVVVKAGDDWEMVDCSA